MDETEENVAPEQPIDEVLCTLLKSSVIEDGNILGHFDDLDVFNVIVQKLKEYGYSFSVRNSDVRKKKPMNQINTEGKRKESGQNAVFYHSKSTSIKFFGLPFTVEKTINYQCTYGFKYYKSKAKLKMQRHESQGITLPVKKRQNIVSKKMGCLATMTLKKVNVYPDYPLEEVRDWRKKKRLIESLRRDLDTAGVEVNRFSRYFLSVSIQSRHNHPPFLHNYLVSRKKRTSSEAAPVSDKKKNCNFELEDESRNWVTLYSVPQDDEQETNKEESPPLFEPLVTYNLKINPSSGEETSVNEVRTYHIETLRCPSIQDLQLLFKEKLKKLYSLSESCENSDLLVRLLGDLSETEVALENDIAYVTTL